MKTIFAALLTITGFLMLFGEAETFTMQILWSGFSFAIFLTGINLMRSENRRRAYNKAYDKSYVRRILAKQ
jgi:hypothetical protein